MAFGTVWCNGMMTGCSIRDIVVLWDLSCTCMYMYVCGMVCGVVWCLCALPVQDSPGWRDWVSFQVWLDVYHRLQGNNHWGGHQGEMVRVVLLIWQPLLLPWHPVQVECTDERIDLDRLRERERIHFYEEMVLFEDELADNGTASLTLKMVSTTAGVSARGRNLTTLLILASTACDG